MEQPHTYTKLDVIAPNRSQHMTLNSSKDQTINDIGNKVNIHEIGNKFRRAKEDDNGAYNGLEKSRRARSTG